MVAAQMALVRGKINQTTIQSAEEFVTMTTKDVKKQIISVKLVRLKLVVVLVVAVVVVQKLLVKLIEKLMQLIWL